MDSEERREPRFEHVRLVGEGATGRVELARLTEPFEGLEAGTSVAVKRLNPALAEDPRALAAFCSEAEAGRLVRDPSLVRILHQGEQDGRPYLLMQYVPGRSLREALADGPLPEPLVRSVGAQLAGALTAVHEAGLVHGDVKPENVRLDDEGRAVLLDLGFARLEVDVHQHAGMGSLAYLSPERGGGAPPSPQADVFALGVVLYELATGLHPFFNRGDGDRGVQPAGLGSTSGALVRRSIVVPGADELLAAINRARLVPPSHLEVTLSPFLDQVLADSLARLPFSRPTARELAERLEEGESGAWWRARVDPADPGGGSERAMPLVRAGKHLWPVVGRDAELALLARALKRARAGEAGVVWVSGPEGCGKWRLVSEFAQSARTSDDPPLYLYTRWNEVAESEPAGALLTLLRRWLRLPTGAKGGRRELRRLEDLVGPRTASTLLCALAPTGSETSSDSVIAAVIAWLQALAARQPILLFIDDLHSAGAVTLSAVSALLDALADMRLLVILGARDDLTEVDPGFERLSARVERGAAEEGAFPVWLLPLGPLSLEAMQRLVDAVFASSVPRGRLAEVLWRRTQGNPGLATEILYDLLSDGRATTELVDGVERWVLTIPPDALPQPRSLDRIVRERFLHLAPPDRVWLERLSVVGGRIAPDFLLQAFPPTGRGEIDAVLARLVRLGWLVSVGSRYRFARPSLRETLYRSLSPERRRRLHLSAASGLTRPGKRAGAEETFQRAFHLRAASESSELYDLCLAYVRSYSRSASARRLLTIARWGLEAAEELNEHEHTAEHLELLEVAADAADSLGRRDEERALLDYLVSLDLNHEEAPAEAARIYLLHARYASGTGQFGLARGMLRNALQLARASDEPRLVSQAQRMTSQVQAQLGAFAEAESAAQAALASARGSHQIALAHLALAHLYVLTDALEDALEEVNRAVRELRGARQVRLGVAAYANLLRARVLRCLGRSARALGAARRAVELARRAGERRLEAEARARLGGLLLDLDRPEDAERELRDAQLLADEVEDRRGQVLVRLWIGLLLWEADSDRARPSIESGIRLAHEIGFFRAEAFGLAIQARIHREHGDLERAEVSSAQGIELVERHGAELADRIVTVGTRALVLEQLGRDSEARRLLRGLRQHLRGVQRRLHDPELREEFERYAEDLLNAVLSPDGPVLPRTRVS